MALPMSESHPDEATFEEALVRLEKTVRALEDGQLSLEEALACYEEGVGLIKRCYGRLREAEQRILQLAGVNPDGAPVLQPFRHEATAAKTTEVAVAVRHTVRKPASEVQ
jgi:exodeoxyribonuclease VII small subunit